MWLVTLLVMIGQFVVIGAVLAVVVFAIVDWFKQDDAVAS